MDDKLLQNGVTIPPIGFGTWKIPDGEVVASAVESAIRAGYRLIDTAMIYKNEAGVGEGIRRSGVDRSELFITTKLWYVDQGYDAALKAIDTSLSKLGLDYVDLYLMHWPFEKRVESWRAMEEIYKSKKAKSIGVSNFLPRHFESILESGSITPMVNQVEFHPFLYDQLGDIQEFCNENNILIEAYSPLAHAHNLDDPAIHEIAKKHGKSNAQIQLRWSIEKGTVPIPKSTNTDRIKENLNIFDFSLDDEDIKTIDGLGKNMRTCADPNELD